MSRNMNIKSKDFEFKINDILYTTDGRKTGNLTVVKIFEDEYGVPKIMCYSDYGNQVTHSVEAICKGTYFHDLVGLALQGHKYRDYIYLNPELFV